MSLSYENMLCYLTIAWRALTGSVAPCAHMLPQQYYLYAFGHEHAHSTTARRHFVQDALMSRRQDVESDHLANSYNMRVNHG